MACVLCCAKFNEPLFIQLIRISELLSCVCTLLYTFASNPNDGMVSQPRISSVLVADSRLVFGYLCIAVLCDIGQHFRLFLDPFFPNRSRGVHHGSGRGVRQSVMPGDHCPKDCVDACTG